MHYAEDALSAERNNGIVEGIQQGLQQGIVAATIKHVADLLDYGLSIEEVFKAIKIDDSLKDKVLTVLKQKTDCES